MYLTITHSHLSPHRHSSKPQSPSPGVWADASSVLSAFTPAPSTQSILHLAACVLVFKTKADFVPPLFISFDPFEALKIKPKLLTLSSLVPPSLSVLPRFTLPHYMHACHSDRPSLPRAGLSAEHCATTHPTWDIPPCPDSPLGCASFMFWSELTNQCFRETISDQTCMLPPCPLYPLTYHLIYSALGLIASPCCPVNLFLSLVWSLSPQMTAPQGDSLVSLVFLWCPRDWRATGRELSTQWDFAQ